MFGSDSKEEWAKENALKLIALVLPQTFEKCFFSAVRKYVKENPPCKQIVIDSIKKFLRELEGVN